VCYDEDGNVHPDPRQADREFCGAVTGNVPGGSCSASGVRAALESNTPPPDPNPDRECDPTGTWRIDVPEDCPLEFACSADTIDLEFSVPGDVEVSDNGCELDLLRTDTWTNSSECGAYGFRIHLVVDGDTAHGRAYRAESGFCSSHDMSSATAVRLN
jgi:hypothetical protein